MRIEHGGQKKSRSKRQEVMWGIKERKKITNPTDSKVVCIRQVGNAAKLSISSENVEKRDCVSNRSGQTCSKRTAEGQRPQGACGGRTLELWGSEGGASSLGPRDGLRGPGEA